MAAIAYGSTSQGHSEQADCSIAWSQQKLILHRAIESSWPCAYSVRIDQKLNIVLGCQQQATLIRQMCDVPGFSFCRTATIWNFSHHMHGMPAYQKSCLLAHHEPDVKVVMEAKKNAKTFSNMVTIRESSGIVIAPGWAQPHCD